MKFFRTMSERDAHKCYFSPEDRRISHWKFSNDAYDVRGDCALVRPASGCKGRFFWCCDCSTSRTMCRSRRRFPNRSMGQHLLSLRCPTWITMVIRSSVRSMCECSTCWDDRAGSRRARVGKLRRWVARQTALIPSAITTICVYFSLVFRQSKPLHSGQSRNCFVCVSFSQDINHDHGGVPLAGP